MNLADAEDQAAAVRRLGEVFAGQRVVLGPRVLAATPPELAMLAQHGASAALVVASARGAGGVPEDDDAEVVWLPRRTFATMSEEVRAEDERVRLLPADAVRRIEAFDPDRAALWLATPFVTSDEPILGRTVVGARRAAWAALEDKVLAEEVWEEARVPHAPSRVVPADLTALERAGAELDRGAGVVWSGDAREGLNGGGNLVRWVTDAEERAAAAAYLAEHCDRVRVLPFLDGVPCSIHGFAADDGTAVFRPVEISMLRRGHDLVYGGLASSWAPPPADREDMREAARRVGQHLRHRVGYRGFFGVDGVLTSDGFRPTELNPRQSAGVHVAFSGLDEPDLARLLQIRATVAGPFPLTAAAEVESVLPVLDDHPAARITTPWEGAVPDGVLGETDEERLWLRYDGSQFVEDRAGELFAAGLTDSGLFGYIREYATLSPGHRVAPHNAALMRFVDARYGTAFGEVEPAPDLRL